MTRFALLCRIGLIIAGVMVPAVARAADAAGHSAATAADCARLAHLAFVRTTITDAVVVAADSLNMAGRIDPPGMNLAGRPMDAAHNPAFCRIRAVVRPGPQSAVKSEIWLPLTGWNGRFLHVASFGWGGTINTGALLTGVQEHYATATNDTGHDPAVDGEGGRFAMGPRDKLLDYAGRANHGMTIAAKAMIRSFYGRAARWSYLVGCSLGGLQGLQAARHYPADYNGIVSGAPPNPIVAFNAAQVWPAYLINQNPARALSAAKLALVARATIAACASPVGRAQGFVEQPDRCAFDPAALRCTGADSDDCLTAPQVEMVRLIHRGPVNPRTGATIFMGPPKGSEDELGMFVRRQPMEVAADLFRYAAFHDPDWDFGAFDYDRQYQAAVAKLGPLLHVDADLSAFLRRGGKLLFYIGWNEYHNPVDLAAYYRRVLAHAGSRAARNQVRLFMIPGMGHCANGPGCDTFSKIGVIDAWVARGDAPDTIITSKYAGGAVVRSRPICAWPNVAQYRGSGDIARADSFVCTTPLIQRRR
jgi:feruloyl esterase